MTQGKRLSKRENEVVYLLLQGKTNKQIAFILGISDRTVEFHLKNVYAKHEVSSRVELILKLGQSPGSELGKSTVDFTRESTENRDRHNPRLGWAVAYRKAISLVDKELEMKKRWSLYFLTGLIFGVSYWHYFSVTANFFSSTGSGDSAVIEILLLILALMVYFGVWLFPTVLPAIYEFRCSKSLHLSTLAVVTVWLSAVLGYYINYVGMLALVGLPHMEYLVVTGQKTPALWKDWSVIFPKLIFYKFVKWVIVGVLFGGIAGLTTGKTYSSMLKNKYKISSV